MSRYFVHFVVIVTSLLILSPAHAQTTITATTPPTGTTVTGTAPAIYVVFSAPVVAPADAIRLYRLGAAEPTPGPDDTPIALSAVTLENGGTRARLQPAANLADGNYAVVVYGNGSTTSGPGQMMRFDRDQLTLDLAAYLNLTEFTMEGWTYWYSLPTTGSNSYGAIFDIGQDARNVPGFWLSHFAGDDVQFGCVDENSIQTEILVNNVLTVNRWYHLAATSSLTEGMKLYANGELIGSLPTPCIPANGSPVYDIALSGYSRWAGSWDWADASFDEMRVWDTARTQAQIQSAMHTPLAGDEPGLLVYHRLDGNTNDLIDSTGNGYAGSRNNAIRTVSDAPLIEMSAQSVTDLALIPVDADGDGNPGGVFVGEFGVDNTAPRVTQTNIGFNGCTTTLGFTDLVVYFDDEMDAGTLIPANVSLTHSNGDGVFNDGDDVPLAINSVSYDNADRSATITLGSLRPDDTYVLQVRDLVQNAAGLSLDGDYPGMGGSGNPLPSGDGAEGRDFTYQFVVDSMDDCNGNGIADVCDVVFDNRIYISEFGASNSFALAGDATFVGNTLRLVPTIDRREGAAWLTAKQDVGTSFETEFTFVLNPSASGADGLAFVIQNASATAIGGDSEALGYGGISSSLAVEFDTFPNNSDFADNHISVQSLGLSPNNYTTGASLGSAFPGVELSNGTAYSVRIVYDSGVLFVYFDGDPTPILSVTVNISDLLGLASDGQAWVGFTASTGGLNQNHDIIFFSFENASVDCNADGIPDDCQLDGNDCNADGIPDECQLAGNDVNANNIPDGCELDCNNNGLPDDIDLANCPMGDISCADCNGNGVLDSCEISTGGSGSLRFDGDNDLVRVLDDELLKPDALTIEMWAKFDGIQTRLARLLRKSGNFQPGYILSATTSGSDPTVHFFANETVFDTQQHSAYVGEWHHFAGTSNDGDIRLYVDGQLLATVQTTSGPVIHSLSDLTIGGATFGSTEFFQGDIDEVRIWDYARSPAEIAGDFHRGLVGNEPGLIAYYRFDAGVGQSVIDSSPNTLNGTLGLTAASGADDPTWISENAPIAMNDCNENGVLDECEIADMSVEDCNDNGIPDACEPGGPNDCDNNGESDLCAIFGGSADCNGDFIPDECQLQFNDCDGNGVPDECDPDCDGNMIPDACDIANCPMGDLSCIDCNGNDVLDSCELSIGGDGSLRFDGANDYVNVLNQPLLEPDNVTVEMWVRYDAIQSTFTRLLRKGGSNQPGYFLTANRISSARQTTFLGSAEVSDSNLHDAYIGQWRYFAGSYNNGIHKIYVDGQLVDTVTANAGPLQHSDSNLTIGGATFSISEYFQGDIDEVRIWDYARSDLEISENYNRGLTGDEPGLIAYYRFDTATGQAVIDSSPNGIDGTLGANSNAAGDDPTRISENAPILDNDCNENGILDECDIADMTADDCNGNGIPDECESVSTNDCDNDGETDLCAIANGAADCNADGIPDDCQLDQNDCNANGVPDDCDPDCDGNMIPDVCDLANCIDGDITCADCNNNDVLDICELLGNDCNSNGIPDECDLADCPMGDASCADCNGNGVPDSCDILTEQFALSFDGSDYVFVPNSASLSITSNLTIEMWARMGNPAGGSQQLLIKGDDSSGQDPYFIRVGSNNLEFGIDGDAGQTARLFAPIGQFDWTTYHHIAAVLDDDADEMYLYIDGVAIASTTTAITPMTVQTPHYLTLGGTVGAGQAFAGTLDDIRIWSLARTETEIQENFDGRLTGEEAGLVALWRCDEGSGQQLLDDSPAGNNGRLGANFNVIGDSRDPSYINETADLPLNDCDLNGILDECGIADMTADDCDANGVPDACQPGGDSDCDNDGESDFCELFNGAADCNADGIPDDCQLEMNDCDGNGVPDDCQDDCDGNGIPDICDIANCPMGDVSCIDCNGNDVLDSCEISAGGGGSLRFDGSNDLVRVLDDALLKPGALTVEMWARFDGIQQRLARMLRKNLGGGYILSATDQLVNPTVHFFANGTIYDTQEHSAYLGTWHHFAGTAENGDVRFYVDGQLVAIAQGNPGPIPHSNSDLTIGGTTIGSNEYFRGDIDEVRIWNYARSDLEISENYDRGLAGDEPGLIAYYRFDTGTGQDVFDSSPNGLNGALGANSDAASDDPTWLSENAPILINDCNQNGILDECDITAMTSSDCDANGVPDECQFGGDSDCDNDGESDFCELFNGATDCNGDLIPDECQLATLDCNENGIVDSCEIGGPNDCNSDAIPDSCQLDGNDCNSNGVLDVCETGGTADCNGNGEIDFCDLFNGVADDCNANGVLDSCDLNGGGSSDVNMNNVPDNCETEVRIMPVIRSINPLTNSPMAATLPESVSSVRLGGTTYVEIWASDIGMDTGGIVSTYMNVVLSGNLNVPMVFHEDDFDFFALGNPIFGGVVEFGGTYLGMDSLGVAPNWVRIGWIEFLAGPNSLSVNLAPASNGVTTLGGNVPASFIEFGSASAVASLPQITYDLTDDNFVGVNDLLELLDGWMDTVPPADTVLDFDCDGVVGPGDLSWFATGWQRSAGDFAIAYPPCALSNPQPLPTEANDIDIRLIPRMAASASDSAAAPPEAQRMLMNGQAFIVEVWINDGGLLTGGITSTYLDIQYQGGVSVGALATHPSLNLEATGSDDGTGIISALGGSTIDGGFASDSMWERVATIDATATGNGAAFTIDPATAMVAAYGRGLIDELAITNTSIITALPGDIDLDMDVDLDDVALFIDVILGNDTDAERQALCDLNGDGAANGIDIEILLTLF